MKLPAAPLYGISTTIPADKSDKQLGIENLIKEVQT